MKTNHADNFLRGFLPSSLDYCMWADCAMCERKTLGNPQNTCEIDKIEAIRLGPKY